MAGEDNKIVGDNDNNTLRGTDRNDLIQGLSGDDSLFGYGGLDRLLGGSGDDFLYGGLGADELLGGPGSDRVLYRDSSAGVVVDLRDPSRNTGEARGDTYASIENISGSTYDDKLYGTDDANIIFAGFGKDTLLGRGGGDLLFGGEDDDLLQGGDGNDFLNGGGGADELKGGSGIDAAVYWAARSAVTADLANAARNTGEAVGDTYFGIEDLSGSNHNDELAGDAQQNKIFGRDGNDTIFGRDGNDTILGEEGDDILLGGDGDDYLSGGEGADDLQGGTGMDRATYFQSETGVSISLLDPGSNTGIAAGDTYSGIEGLVGSDFNDIISGDGGDNELIGRLGDDILQGRKGNDLLEGREGNDRMTGSAGDDILDGGAGADELFGGDGMDLASYQDSGSAVEVDLVNTSGNTGHAAGDTFTSIEGLIGSDYDDVLRGTDTRNSLYGGIGADTIRGRNGSDTLVGGGGNDILVGGNGTDILNGGFDADSLDGGRGWDTATYADAVAAVRVDLKDLSLNTGEAKGDTYTDIEVIEGTAFDDFLRGSDKADGFIGGDGNDVLRGRKGSDDISGGRGDDTLIGAEGRDVLNGGLGADMMDGGNGVDTATYEDASSGVRVDLAGGFGDAGEADGDTLVGIEVLVGSAFDDVLRGSDKADTLQGGAGNDTLRGRIGSDELSGGAGDDILIGGKGADLLTGGAGADEMSGEEGTDIALYSDAASGVVADLADSSGNTGDAAGDTYTGIEGLAGSEFDDTLNGDAFDNIFYGGDGNDVLRGRGGADTFVFADLPSSGNVDTIIKFVSGEDEIAIDASVFTGLDTGSLDDDETTPLDDDAFVVGTEATTAEQRIIYDETDGSLYYDADGVGGADAELFASLGAGTVLVASDIGLFIT